MHVLVYFKMKMFVCFQNLVQKLGENAKDHKAYNEAFDAATKWLANMEERVQDCNDTAGDWHTLQDRMDAVKVESWNTNNLLTHRICMSHSLDEHVHFQGKQLFHLQV